MTPVNDEKWRENIIYFPVLNNHISTYKFGTYSELNKYRNNSYYLRDERQTLSRRHLLLLF